MRKFFLAFFILVATSSFGGIPSIKDYEWGTIKVPENYEFSGSQKLEIYWEKLKSTSNSPKAIVMINGGPGSTHDGFHQTTSNGKYLKDYLQSLRTDYDVYYFDQRGNGNSSKLDYANLMRHDLGRFGMENICRDIEELRKQVIKKDKISVMGESYGGMVALYFAINYQDSLEKLVLHDTSPSNAYFTNMHQNFSGGIKLLNDGPFPGLSDYMVTAIDKFKNGQVNSTYTITADEYLLVILSLTYSFNGQSYMALMTQQIAQLGESPLLNRLLGGAKKRREAMDRASYSQLNPTLLSVQCYEMLDETKISALNGQADSYPYTLDWMKKYIYLSRRDFQSDFHFKSFSGYDVISKLGQIKVPTLMIVGEFDFVTPANYARLIKSGIGDNCKLVVVKNAAHSGMITQQEYVVGKIRNFLSGYNPGYRLVEKSLDEFKNRKVDLDEAFNIYITNAVKYGIPVVFDEQ